jgi:cysteine desulfurase/selenocysteine lyase
VLNEHNVAIRAGHHCAQPLLAKLGVPATARASFSLYTTKEDIDRLVAALDEVASTFG